MKRVLIVDDEENIRLVLRTVLKRNGYEVETAGNGKQALELVANFGPDFVLTDIRMPELTGLELLAELRAKGSDAAVIVMSAYGNRDDALEAIKAGAYDYLQKPFKNDEVVLMLRKAEEREALRRENKVLRAQVRKDSRFERMLGDSEAMKRVFHTVSKVADYKTTVLITGESGVGKELVARALHTRSNRSSKNFVAVNCGAIPENLMESELFGYRRGAFTDAHQDKQGLFEEADGGTLFLDEVGELTLNVQVKLLRVLQEGTIRRLGDSRSREVDVRIVAATYRDLRAEVQAGRFREDLYYRLNVLPIRVPPLRERPDDISLLINHFIESNNARLGLDIRGMQPEARRMLLKYTWPGNVRELENTIERAMVLCDGDKISVADLPERIRDSQDPIKVHLESDELSIKKTTRLIEEVLIRRALQKTSGNRTKAAKLLEISHRALLYKIKDYGLGDL